MKYRDKTVLVFGATVQQGGSVANALRSNGWRVKALVRDPKTDKSEMLASQGVETVRGDLADVRLSNLQWQVPTAFSAFNPVLVRGQPMGLPMKMRSNMERQPRRHRSSERCSSSRL